MAYDASNEIVELTGDIKRNEKGDYIYVRAIKFKNGKEPAIDVRNMYTDTLGEIKPTSKGIRISDTMAPEVMKAMYLAMSTEARMEFMDLIADESDLDAESEDEQLQAFDDLEDEQLEE